jgi:MFS transporter, ACS family, hexuronate transporter
MSDRITRLWQPTPEETLVPEMNDHANSTATEQASASARKAAPAGWFRWVICGLLFFAITVSYIDRQVIGVLKTTLMQTYHWSDSDFANIIFTFQLAYALGQLLSGWLFDRIGVRVGFMIAVLIWSLAATAHGLIGLIPMDATWSWPLGPGTVKILNIGVISVLGFSLARFALGLPEGGTFPGAVKAVSEWFPRRERALATGLFNAGTNVGAMVTPLAVPILTSCWGWPSAFYATGTIGFAWLLCWWPLYDAPERHRWLSPAELAYIRSDPPDPSAHIPWLTLLRYRQTWTFAIGFALSAPVWWFYLYWIPGFLQDRHGLNLVQLGVPLVTIYLMTDLGSIGGGWLSSHLLKRGWSVNAARKTAMLGCALCVVPVFLAGITASLWTATLLVGLAASAHQGFAANLFTIVSDTMPRKAVSSVIGIGGMAGAFAGMGFAKLTGYILDTGWPGRYAILFTIASTAYLVNLLVIHLLSPRLEPAQFDNAV